MTLPAHRFRDREERKKDKKPHVWTLDVDDTVTNAAPQYARLTRALKDAGDRIVIVTGHGPKAAREDLLDAIGIAYDEIVIVEPEPDGSGKARALKELGSWFHFDDRVQFGPEILKVCPVVFQYGEERQPGDDLAKDVEKIKKDSS